jgi:hypothetical protein
MQNFWKRCSGSSEEFVVLNIVFFFVKCLYLQLRIFSVHTEICVLKLNMFYVVEFYYEILKPEKKRRSIS